MAEKITITIESAGHSETWEADLSDFTNSRLWSWEQMVINQIRDMSRRLLTKKQNEIKPRDEVYEKICEILFKNGFEDGALVLYRPSTGCSFDKKLLRSYKTVTDFQLDWPYS